MRSPLMRSYCWWPMIYLSRWLRLTPVVLFCTLLQWKVIPTFLDVTTTKKFVDAAIGANDSCSHAVWKHIFYVQTLLDKWLADGSCMGHLWYLSSEFMMVWFTPFCFLAWCLHPFLGMFVAIMFMQVGIISSAVISNHYHLG